MSLEKIESDTGSSRTSKKIPFSGFAGVEGTALDILPRKAGTLPFMTAMSKDYL